MLQTLLFTHAITHPLIKVPIALSEADKRVITDIDAIAKRYLTSCGEEGKKILELLPRLTTSELEWADLK